MKLKARITSKGSTRSIHFRISFGAFVKVDPSGPYKKGRKYQQIDYYTGLTIEPRYWDTVKGQTKNDSYVNGQLQRAAIRIREIYGRMAYNGNVEFNDLKEVLQADEKLNEILNKDRAIQVASDYIAPVDFIETFIKKAVVTDGTRKDYNNSLIHMKEFDKYRGKTMNWKSMGYEYYMDLVEYLKTQKRLKTSTIDKIIKNLKVFLMRADLTDNLEVNQDFKKIISGKSLFGKVNKEETEHVYLTESEVKKITDADMRDERLSEIRDLFIIGCWTGLRISDLSRLERDNIKNGLLSITTKKTRQNVVIPVTRELQSILDKYPEQLPKIPTDQHYNREIKKVCEKAGIDDMVMAEVKKGSLITTAPVPKHKLVTSHTARRSFATNLYRRGIPSTQLMFLTGHKTEGAFLKYIKVSKEDNAKDVAMKLKKIG